MKDRRFVSLTCLLGAILALTLSQGLAHWCLLEVKEDYGAATDPQTGWRYYYFQRIPDYRLLGRGKFLLAPALAVDRAIRPQYWRRYRED